MAENMENETLDKMNFTGLFEEIRRENGISLIWIKILEICSALSEEKADGKEDVLKLLCIYFSLLDEGNICIPLDENLLYEQWKTKWNGLLMVAQKSDFKSEDFKPVIEKGIKAVRAGLCPQLFENLSEKQIPASAYNIPKPFVIRKIKGTDVLFASKYFNAKLSIESRVKTLFKPSENQISSEKIKTVTDYFKASTLNKESNTFITLDELQAKAIIRGQSSNLILTGGPGTGKTTTICFLLWELLRNHSEYMNYTIHLAAPSGKAAERIKESISDSLRIFNAEAISENSLIEKKLTEVEPSTIHRMLSYNPANNNFVYNAKNQFDEQSIFIIDEASMIDITLFQSLLEAIPDKARLFILGDEDQLPSVQAGAVLGELLGKVQGEVIRLTKSNRFNDESQIGRLRNELQKTGADGEGCDFPEDMSPFGTWKETLLDIEFKKNFENDKNPVFFYTIKEGDGKKQVRHLVEKWSQAFCEEFIPLAGNLDKENPDFNVLDQLWEKSLVAKILCAERQGDTGVENINSIIQNRIIKNKLAVSDDECYFDGQLLMVTQNQRLFNLYNGDCGVTVSFKGDPLKYLMVEKKQTAGAQNVRRTAGEITGIFRLGNYIFYPLYLLPENSLETAYAITIHKSQGSGYSQILIFLPAQEGHPLLNRQIFYTAITRTKLNTWIIASREAMNFAKKTLIRRNTMIELGTL